MLDKKIILEELADELSKVEAPLFFNISPERISNKIRWLVDNRVLVQNDGIKIYAYCITGDDSINKDLSPRDPITGKRYFFSNLSDAYSWVNLLRASYKNFEFSINGPTTPT